MTGEEIGKTWRLNKPSFQDLPKTLELCGRVVVREIIRCVSERLRPSGAPQKQNAPSTILKKGHDHPVLEKRGRFMKQGTYRVTPIAEDRVMISIANPFDSEVAAHLEGQGYEFFGITDQAEKEAFAIMDGYLMRKVDEAFGGKR